MTQDSTDAMVDPLDDAFSANVLDAIKGMLADKGLIADIVDQRMLLTTPCSLSATDYDGWCNLLRDPLFLLPSTLRPLLKLRDSTALSLPSYGHVTIFYIRTFTLIVAQLQCVLRTLISAKILFASKVFEWQARIASVPGDSLVTFATRVLHKAKTPLGGIRAIYVNVRDAALWGRCFAYWLTLVQKSCRTA